MKKKFAVSLFGIFTAVALVLAGAQFHSALANGETFTPITLSGLTATYNAATQTLNVSGSASNGTEMFTSYTSGCPTMTAGAYPVNGPLTPTTESWTITNSSGTTVLSGPSPTFSLVNNPSPTQTYTFPCASPIAQPNTWSITSSTPVSVSTLAPGTYTFNYTIQPNACVPSYTFAACDSVPPTTSGSASFTIPVPAPTVSLTAAPTSIASGASSTLTIVTTNATTCTWTAGLSGAAPCSGTVSVTPAVNTTYTISVTGAGGSASASASVTVIAVPPPPTVSLTAAPTSIASGASSTLTIVTTNATTCTWTAGLSGVAPCSGTVSVTPLASTTYTISVTGAGGSASASALVTVTAPGTITVTSESSVDSSPLVADWYFSPLSPSNPCGAGTSLTGCQNLSQATYVNQPADPVFSYTICDAVDLGTVSGTPCHVVSTNSNYQYSLNSVRREIATVNHPLNWFEEIMAFGKGILAPNALAMGACGAIDAAPSTLTCESAQSPSWLLSSGSTLNFVLVWDPIAHMTVSPAPVLTATAGSATPATGTFTITNDGSPGSTLTWTAGAPVYDVNSGTNTWLSLSISSDTVPGLGSGALDTITLTATPGALAAGTYTATIPFSGTSAPGIPPPLSSSLTPTLTVTFTVGTPAVVCGDGVIEGTEQCDTPGGIANGPSCPISPCNPVGCVLNPGATGVGNAAVCPPPPVCTPFTATPTNIILPQTSNLKYDCQNVTSCTLSGGGLSTSTAIVGGESSGTVIVAPTSNTTYTFACQGTVPSNPGYSASSTVTVTVGNPHLCEQGVGGVGCPTQ